MAEAPGAANSISGSCYATHTPSALEVQCQLGGWSGPSPNSRAARNMLRSVRRPSVDGAAGCWGNGHGRPRADRTISSGQNFVPRGIGVGLVEAVLISARDIRSPHAASRMCALPEGAGRVIVGNFFQPDRSDLIDAASFHALACVVLAPSGSWPEATSPYLRLLLPLA